MRSWPRLKAWLPAIVWAAVISGLSTDTFSAEHTSIVIVPILRWLFPHANAAMIETMHTLVRKSAHFTEYFVFSILLVWGLRGPERGWKLRWAIWAILIAAGYAAFDEFHQSFVPSRTASPWDALLDTVGASAGQIVLWMIWKTRWFVTRES
jgi:VanZ family protein